MRDRIRLAMLVGLAGVFAASVAWAGETARPVGLKKLIDIDVKEKPLAMVVDHIRQITGENIVLGLDKDGKRLDENKELLVTIKLEGAFWEQALRLVCENAGAKVEILEGNIWRVYQPPEVTLALENADVRVVVDTIGRISGKNIVIGSDVGEGKRVTLRVTNLDWMRALKVVVESVGLTVVPDADGLVYRIADPASLIKELNTEVLPLRYLTLPSDYTATIKNELVTGKMDTPTIQERVKNFTLVKALSAVISKDVGRIDYDLTSNSLLITDTPNKIAEVKKIIQLIDIEPLMIQVDVKFVSSRRTDVMNVGVNWPNGPRIRTDGTTGLGGMYTRFPWNLGGGGWEDQVGVSTNAAGTAWERGPTPANAKTFFSGKNPYEFGRISFNEFQVVLEYLKSDTQTEITQKPTLAVLDNTPATIFVGESVRYAEVNISQTAAGGQAVTISEGANSPVDIGFQLLVKPHAILESRQVKLLLIPTLRDLAGNSKTQLGFDTFAIGNQSIDLPRVAASTVVTEMILEDGETAVIGGLIREIKTESVVKWPILGDIPLLGYLFKNIQTNKERRHVLLFVTLRIMRSPKAAKQALTDQLRERENEAAREFWEDIRREKYAEPEPPPLERKSGEEKAAPEKTSEGGGSSSRSVVKQIEEEASADDEDASGARETSRRSTVRRW